MCQNKLCWRAILPNSSQEQPPNKYGENVSPPGQTSKHCLWSKSKMFHQQCLTVLPCHKTLLVKHFLRFCDKQNNVLNNVFRVFRMNAQLMLLFKQCVATLPNGETLLVNQITNVSPRMFDRLWQAEKCFKQCFLSFSELMPN